MFTGDENKTSKLIKYSGQVLVRLSFDIPRHELHPDVHGPRDHVRQDSLGLETFHREPRGDPRHEPLGLRTVGLHQLHSLQEKNVPCALDIISEHNTLSDL